MVKVLATLLLSVYMFSCTNNTSVEKQKPVSSKEIKVELSTPESTIHSYYEALKKGNKEEIDNLFILNKNLFIEKPLPTIKHQIKSIRFINKKEAYTRNQNNYNIEFKDDDVEIVVKELLGTSKESVVFILRRRDDKWKIYAHSFGGSF